MNYITIGILLVWFLVWVSKNYGTSSVKSYFKKLMAQSKLGFAKIEFELYGLKAEREELRKEFDRLNDSIDAYKVQIENVNNKPETIELFQKKTQETNAVLESIKDAINTKDIAIKVAEETETDLHQQMVLLTTYIEREI